MLSHRKTFRSSQRASLLASTVALCVLALGPAISQAQTNPPVELSLRRSQDQSRIVVGDLFQMTIVLATGSQGVDGAETHVRFDQTQLLVTDFDGNPASSITPGNVFDLVLANKVDNGSGTIDFTGATLGATLPVGDIPIATITFKSIAMSGPAGTSLIFNTSGTRDVTKVTANGALVPLNANGASVPIAPAADPELANP